MLGQDVRAEVSGWEVRREGESWYGWSARRNAQPVGTARGVERAAARARRGLPRAGARPGSVPGSGRGRRLQPGGRPARSGLPLRPPDRPGGRQGRRYRGWAGHLRGEPVAARGGVGARSQRDVPDRRLRLWDHYRGGLRPRAGGAAAVRQPFAQLAAHLRARARASDAGRVGRAIERTVEGRDLHVVLAGDLDATPDAASVRFWRGRQSLGGMSVCYRDAWGSTHPDEPGHTFTAENPLVTAENWDWELELGRRIDHVFVRCTDHGPTLDIRNCKRIFDKPIDGVWGSDHFGVVADLSVQTSSGRPVR